MTIAERLAEADEVLVTSEVTYDGAEPVLVHVRKRGRRYDLDDGGLAVRRAGVEDWRETAERVAGEYALNVNRAGVVFVGAVEGGLDLDWLAGRVAETSAALYGELLETDR